MKETLQYVATTLSGLENILACELQKIGATKTMELKRAVAFDGDNDIIYKANLWCRTALQILTTISSTEIHSTEDLYDHIASIKWEQYLRTSDSFMIQSVVNDTNFINNSAFASLKAKDAIVDRLRGLFGSRPSIDKEDPDLIINIHISNSYLSVAINSTGEPLFKRGYKTGAVFSPLNEVLAAGIVQLAQWNKQEPLFDPFCGSATILTEGAMIAANVAPGLYRKSFAFKRWKNFDENKWNSILQEAKDTISFSLPGIYGSDISRKAVDIANSNIRNAGFADFIDVKVAAFGNFIPPISEGTIISNPPYGLRTDDTNLYDLYRKIGNVLKDNFKGFNCWLLTYEKETVNKIGLHPSTKFNLFNGQLECRLLSYKIY